MLAGYLPNARYLLADKGDDADHWRDWLEGLGSQPVIPSRSNRKTPHSFEAKCSKNRNAIERMCGRLKDFRHIATRYDKKAENFLAGLSLAALVCFWI